MSAQSTQNDDRIRTARLVLRAPALADAEAVATLANNWKVARNLAVVPYPYSYEDAVSWLSDLVDGDGEREVVFAVCLADPRETLIGVCGCAVPAAERAERLGYWFGEPYWGNGYASEAVRALVDYMFAAHPSIEAIGSECHKTNPASRRVLEKCGFEVTGEDIEPCRARATDVGVFKLALGRDRYEARAR